jgi:hypothetical protein
MSLVTGKWWGGNHIFHHQNNRGSLSEVTLKEASEKSITKFRETPSHSPKFFLENYSL